MRQLTLLGRSIEDASFSIIDREAGEHKYPADQWEVVRRMIHATADFEFKDLTVFHPDAVKSGIRALRSGCPLVCDVQMVLAGLNKERLEAYGCRAHSFINDEDVIRAAKAENSTRAAAAMRKAWREGLFSGAIVAVGNAPTALLETVRMTQAEPGDQKPALVVGVPVGFVSAQESKEAVVDSDVPYIITRGRKGGSTIAVAVLHALLLLSARGGS